MNFGYGYQERESLQLEEGIYTARIKTVEFRNSKGFNIMDIKVDIKGKPGYKPDHISFFDRPQDPALQDGWDVRMTRFFDAFGIQRGNWDTRAWCGNIGEIEVLQNKKNPQFMDIFPYIRTTQTAQAQIPTAQAQHTQAPAQHTQAPAQTQQQAPRAYEGNLSRPQYAQTQAQQQGGQAQKENLFTDEIPF